MRDGTLCKMLRGWIIYAIFFTHKIEMKAMSPMPKTFAIWRNRFVLHQFGHFEYYKKEWIHPLESVKHHSNFIRMKKNRRKDLSLSVHTKIWSEMLNRYMHLGCFGCYHNPNQCIYCTIFTCQNWLDELLECVYSKTHVLRFARLLSGKRTRNSTIISVLNSLWTV